MMSKIKVSVVLITYNHENYIRQAIESILFQEFKGELEIIIADDCSTDQTLNIIKQYERFSHYKFKYLYNESNLGITKNYQRALKVCEGDYIAILEGDDYWCNPYRLQSHTNFLNEHRECVLSRNNAIIYSELEKSYYPPDLKDNRFTYITFNDLLFANWVGNYSSCVYRTAALKMANPKLYEVEFDVLDEWLIGLELTQFGLAAILPEATTIYRKGVGVYSQLSEKEKLYRILRSIKELDSYFDYKYTKSFKIHYYRIQKEIKKMKQHELALNFPPIIFNFVDLIKFILRNIIDVFYGFLPNSITKKIKQYIRNCFQNNKY